MNKIITRIEATIKNAIQAAYELGWVITSGNYGDANAKTACALTALALGRVGESRLVACGNNLEYMVLDVVCRRWRISEMCARCLAAGFDGCGRSVWLRAKPVYRAWYLLGRRLRRWVGKRGFDRRYTMGEVFGVRHRVVEMVLL